MKSLCFPTAAEVAERAASIIVERIRAKPDIVLGLATGVTMEPVYEALLEAYRGGAISFADVTSFNLDEYTGLPASYPSSYRATMQRLLFDHVDIDPARTHLPDGDADDLDKAATLYERQIIAAGGIDLQLLGIGQNGHIGFNEPHSEFSTRTRTVALHSTTMQANAAFFPNRDVPRNAITMGIATILDAREIIILATGAVKRAAVTAALYEPVDESCPASALRSHPNTLWLLDAEARPLALA